MLCQFCLRLQEAWQLLHSWSLRLVYSARQRPYQPPPPSFMLPVEVPVIPVPAEVSDIAATRGIPDDTTW